MEAAHFLRLALAIAVNLAAIYVMVRLEPASAPVGSRMPWRERWAALRAAAPVLFLMVAVFGGVPIFLGWLVLAWGQVVSRPTLRRHR